MEYGQSKRYVAYYRVSTEKQGRSGLGLDAQREAVALFIPAGSADRIVAEFTETESGKRNDRPVLSDAIAHAKAYGATLLIAKLDRLSRNAAFLLTLRDQGVPFIAADMPSANSTVIGIMAVIAQAEREAISARTKAALEQAKKKGIRLGNPNGAAAIKHLGNAKAAQGAKDKATSFAAQIAPVIADIRKKGHTTPTAIAKELKARTVPTARGGCWTAQGVINILCKIEQMAA
jgi:DNA invertase Pin-like site-specific DNA recombinase